MRDERLEMQGHAANDLLGGIDDKQFIKNRLVRIHIFEEVANRNQHFQLCAVETHERQRLPHLDVESGIKRRPLKLAS